MAKKEQQDLARHILELVGTVNPYNRQGENSKSEFYLYQGGFLAGYLASVFLEDPIRYREFKQHIAAKKG